MGKADILSRMTGHKRGENNNENIVMLTPEMFLSLLSLNTPEDIFINDIKKHRTHLDELVKISLSNKNPEWKETDGIVTWQNRIYVPKDQELRG